MDNLEEIFDGKEPEIEVVEKVEETIEATPEPTGEKETETEKVEDKESSPDLDVETKVPLSAMHGERDRRQAAERELNELKTKLEDSNKADPTSVFEDENKFRSEIQQDLSQTLLNNTLNQSEFFAAREMGRTVLDAKIEVFKTLVQDNPSLQERFANSVSPFHELVAIVDQHDELDKMKDLDAYKAKLRAEAKAEAKAEIESELEAKAKLRDSIPDSLVGDTSTGGLTSKDWGGPPSAEEIFDSP